MLWGTPERLLIGSIDCLLFLCFFFLYFFFCSLLCFLILLEFSSGTRAGAPGALEAGAEWWGRETEGAATATPSLFLWGVKEKQSSNVTLFRAYCDKTCDLPSTITLQLYV